MTALPPTMPALRWHARGDLRLGEVPTPSLTRPGDVLVRVAAAGICGTDIEEWIAGPINIGQRRPVTLGHEFAGTVVAGGPGAPLPPGTRVMVDPNTSCGSCARCRAGASQQCAALVSLGLHADGGLATFAVASCAQCLPIPDAVAFVRAILAEPLAVGVRALDLTGVVGNVQLGANSTGSAPLPRAGSPRARQPAPGPHHGSPTVWIVGGGAVGQLTARAAAARGAQVTLVEPDPGRRAVARAAGLTALDPREAAAVRGPDGDGPADVVLECAGYPGAVRDALGFAQAGGRVGVIGVNAQPIGMSPWDLMTRERSLIGVLSHTRADMERALALLADGSFGAGGIVTHRVPLADALGGAFHPLALANPSYLKVVIEP